ncbi:MAG: hypothetical protein EOO17_04025 [Chloroflexi bacterium]|nr:MAG: hypothetical protein EOO17_04025 [Chloroflexota bacterium]
MPIPQLVVTDRYFLKCLERAGQIEYLSTHDDRGFEIGSQLVNFHPAWETISNQRCREIINRLAVKDQDGKGMVSKVGSKLSSTYQNGKKNAKVRDKLIVVSITQRGREFLD